MLPVDIPPGTTVESLFTEVVPDLHARFVTDDSPGEHTAVVRVIGGQSYTYVARGRTLGVEEGEAPRAPLWIAVRRDAVELFLADWSGARRFVPSYAPPGGVVVLTDPRILKRLAMASGKLEIALTDFPGHGRVAMTVACGDPAKKGIDEGAPNVIVEATTRTLERILEGALSPDLALADGDVSIEGSRLFAMQIALALAPFYPQKR